MGGKIKASRPSRRGAVFRPVDAGWQRWEEDEAGAWSLAAEAGELAALKPTAGGTIAVPVRRAFSLALWFPGDDPALFGDLLYTQIELRGLAGRSRALSSFAWQEVAREGNEALLHASVLPSQLAARYWDGEVTNYAVSPACLPLASDAVSLWREEGGWVAAVTRGGQQLHFQPLTETVPDAAMAREVWLMLAPLEAGRMTRENLPVEIFYEGASAPDLEDWRMAGQLAVSAKALPAPVRPAAELCSVPQAVREVQQTKAAGSRRQRLALLAAAAYFVIVLALAANTLRLHGKARSLAAEIARDEQEVSDIQAAMQRWNALEPALDPALYPLEVLHQAASLLPKDGVRLTLFQMSPERVVIAGEASTLTEAQRFQEQVEKNAELAAFVWKKEPPRPLPTGSSRFQIDGVRAGAAPADEEVE